MASSTSNANTPNAKSLGSIDSAETVPSEERPLSFLAVIAFVMALLSPLTFVSLKLVALPVATFIVAVTAYLLLTVGKAPKRGQGLALIATAIGGLVGSWGCGTIYFEMQHRYQVATEFSEKWLQMMGEGKREEVFEMTLNEASRQLENLNLAEFYANQINARRALENFYTKQPVKMIVKRGTKPKWVFAGGRGVKSTTSGDIVKIVMEDIQGDVPLRVQITLIRNPRETVDDHLACWHIQDIELGS